MSSFAASLRAARNLLGLSQVDVEAMTGIERRMIGRIEGGRWKLAPRAAFKLQDAYEKNGVEFLKPNDLIACGIRFRHSGQFDAFKSAQLRAARAMLGLSQSELAALSGLDKSFIARLEQNKVEAVSIIRLEKLIDRLSALGVELTPATDRNGVGVSLKPGM
jgi:transcriptional regulator with XRE-family HTH domain